MNTVYKKLCETPDDVWNRISTGNASIKTTDIKGKEYAEVNQRVKAFRYAYPRGKIETKIISLDGEIGERCCLMRCEVFDDLGNLLSTGYAEEKEGSTFINRTSFIENCETSCVGRALGQAGFGIELSIASLEEVENAIANQISPYKKPTVNKLSSFVKAYSDDERQRIREHYGVEKDDELPRDVVDKYIKDRKDKVKEVSDKIRQEFETRKDLDGEENPFY